jgi:hypothetical protein
VEVVPVEIVSKVAVDDAAEGKVSDVEGGDAEVLVSSTTKPI